MHEKLAELKDKLDHIHTELEDITFPQKDLIAWNKNLFPAIETDDLVFIPYELSKKLNRFKKFTPSDDDEILIDQMISAVEKTKVNLINLSSGNVNVASQSIISFMLTMFFISNTLNELFSFEVLQNRELLPKKIINRLSLYDENLDEIKLKAGDIEHKIKTIIEAYDAAESLPTTVKNLRATNEEIEKLKEQSSENQKKIEDFKKKSEDCYEDLSERHTAIFNMTIEMKGNIDSYMASYKEQAQSYIDSCEIALRTTTTKGLAGAFNDKANKLNASIRWWVVGLMCALAMGACVGYFRLQVLEQYLASNDASTLKLIVQIFLSIMSVGAPLWFAWLATKQIGQRFRLAEDYEFKASVSKAYEGYRKEAVNLDISFAQRLFGNALTRLEEPPLRFIEEDTHSSPLMEIISSNKFKDFVAKGDGVIDTLLHRAGLQRNNNEPKKPRENERKDSSVSLRETIPEDNA